MTKPKSGRAKKHAKKHARERPKQQTTLDSDTHSASEIQIDSSDQEPETEHNLDEPTSSKEGSRLLALPGEIRNRILKYALVPGTIYLPANTNATVKSTAAHLPHMKLRPAARALPGAVSKVRPPGWTRPDPIVLPMDSMKSPLPGTMRNRKPRGHYLRRASSLLARVLAISTPTTSSI